MWFLFFFVQHSETVDVVRNGTMDIYPYYSVASLFEKYPYWKTFKWVESEGGLVSFLGTFSYEEAQKLLEDRHEYAFRMSMKATHLKPYYSLEKITGDPLKIEIQFQVEGESFAVLAGKLYSEEKAIHQMKDKTVLAVIKGMYRKHDPLEILINGLPYK